MSKLSKLIRHPRQFFYDARPVRAWRDARALRSANLAARCALLPIPKRATSEARGVRERILGEGPFTLWSASGEEQRWIFRGEDVEAVAATLCKAEGAELRLRWANGTHPVIPQNERKVIGVLREGKWGHLDIFTGDEGHVVISLEKWLRDGDMYEAPRSNPLARRVSAAVARAHRLFAGGGYSDIADIWPAPPLAEPDFPIDVVYTWVNHLDPQWEALRAAATGSALDEESSDARSAERFYSRDELRFSLRSVFKYATWVNRIYIVSNCRPPQWLDLRHPKITWVWHEEILAPDCLPTFNSHAIESRLQHIRGLSNAFLYFNDDFLLTRSLKKSDFFTANGLSRAFLEPYGCVSGAAQPGEPDYLNAARNGQAMLARRFGRAPVELHKHTPYALRRDVLCEMEAVFAVPIQRTSRAKFRTPDDVSTVSFLYHHYAFLTGRAIRASRSAALLKPQSPGYARRMDRIVRKKETPSTVCVNDGAGSATDGAWNERVVSFLERLLPDPCAYELQAGEAEPRDPGEAHGARTRCIVFCCDAEQRFELRTAQSLLRRLEPEDSPVFLIPNCRDLPDDAAALEQSGVRVVSAGQDRCQLMELVLAAWRDVRAEYWVACRFSPTFDVKVLRHVGEVLAKSDGKGPAYVERDGKRFLAIQGEGLEAAPPVDARWLDLDTIVGGTPVREQLAALRDVDLVDRPLAGSLFQTGDHAALRLPTHTGRDVAGHRAPQAAAYSLPLARTSSRGSRAAVSIEMLSTWHRDGWQRRVGGGPRVAVVVPPVWSADVAASLQSLITWRGVARVIVCTDASEVPGRVRQLCGGLECQACPPRPSEVHAVLETAPIDFLVIPGGHSRWTTRLLELAEDTLRSDASATVAVAGMAARRGGLAHDELVAFDPALAMFRVRALSPRAPMRWGSAAATFGRVEIPASEVAVWDARDPEGRPLRLSDGGHGHAVDPTDAPTSSTTSGAGRRPGPEPGRSSWPAAAERKPPRLDGPHASGSTPATLSR